MDVVLFVTYFTNMFVVNLSVVTVPALAATTFANPAASAAFESSVASMAPMGGAIGKVINGFVCQRLGGRRASWIYLVGLAVLSCGMSITQSIGSIGAILMFYEFLSSVQWTSICLVLDDKHKNSPRSIARGVAILSLSSYTGALAAKTVGAALLNSSGCWRSVTRVGSLVALIGASAMYFGISPPDQKRSLVIQNSARVDESTAGADVRAKNPISVLKSIVTHKLFWMIGIGHSLGYVIRGSDRLLVPFLHQATGFPRHICASLTSFVTLGLVVGLGKGTAFSAMESIPDKMKMLKRNYIRAIFSFLGLGACALNVMNGWIQAPYLMAVIISTLSCLAASSISFQLSQVPILVASNMFAENKAVALSLVDAGGFFFTSQIFAANSKILGTFGWSASWTFLAMVLAVGASLMMKYMPPVLVRERQRVALQV
jgi:MFS family permease